jgi:quinol monooxygenase YgiN
MITGQTRKEPGCRHCSILHDTDSDNRVGMESHWEHMDFVDDYFRSEHFSALLGAINILAIDYELAINEGSPFEGQLTVDRARQTK